MENRLFGKVNVLYDDRIDRIDAQIELVDKALSEYLDSTVLVVLTDHAYLDGTITLRPNNVLYGTVDVVEPPLRKHYLTPTKDSLVREHAPHMNYGTSSTLVSGKADEGRFSTYMGFDLDQVPPEQEIESATLRMEVISGTASDFFLSIFNTSNKWSETAIRWDNRPVTEERLSRFVAPKERGVIEIDLMDFFQEWYDEGGERSLVIQPANYDVSETIYFWSRESNDPPVLEVTYYEIPGIPGSSRLDSEVTIAVKRDNSLPSTVDVSSNWLGNDLDLSIELESKSGLAEIDAGLVVAIRESEEISLQVELESKHHETEITSEIIVPHASSINASVETESKYGTDSIESSVSIMLRDSSGIDSTVDVTEKEAVDFILSSVTVRSPESSDLISEFVIENKGRFSEIGMGLYIKQSEIEEIDSHVELLEKESFTEINATADIREHSFMVSSITLEEKHDYYDIDMAINIKEYVETDARVELVEKNEQTDISGSIELNEKEGHTAILSGLIVRIPWADELDSIVDVTRAFELNAHIQLENKYGDSYVNASIFIDDGGDYAFIM